jgi:hypothetical protein
MRRPCNKCGVSFEPKGGWQRRCWDCWQAQKDRDEAKERYEAATARAMPLVGATPAAR